METGKRRQRDRDEATKRTPMKTARRRWCDEDGATNIAATEATTWLNRGAESIDTLNLDFRVKGKNSLSFLIWEGTREFT